MIGKDWVDHSPSDFVFPNRHLGNLALPPGNWLASSLVGSDGLAPRAPKGLPRFPPLFFRHVVLRVRIQGQGDAKNKVFVGLQRPVGRAAIEAPGFRVFYGLHISRAFQVEGAVTAAAQGDEVLLAICARLAPPDHVVDLELIASAATLAFPAIPLQDVQT
jgi:hypothetical protein